MEKGSIGTLLLTKGLIQQDHLQQAKELQGEKGGRLGDILIGMGVLTEEQFQEFLAATYGFKYFGLGRLMSFRIDRGLLESVPYKVALNNLILPVERDKGVLTLATLAPLPERHSRQLLQRTQCKDVAYGLAAREVLLKAIRYHYGKHMRQVSTHEAPSGGTSRREDSRNLVALRMEGMCPSCGFPCETHAKECPNCGQPLGHSSQVDPLIGLILDGKWKLIRQVGEGGMGLVYQGAHTETGQDVAIKLLRTQFKVDDQAVQRFYHESQILRKLSHPNIVKVFEFGFEDEIGFYLVMERLQGCDLEQFTSQLQEDVPLSEVYKIFIRVCDAMYHAHENGVIHRDLKPENIFLVGGPQQIQEVKLLDFGIAKIKEAEAKRLTQTGMTLGTPRYLSPEQAMGTEIDHRTDIYSLSVILFETLTGCDLFDAESPYQYLMRHVYAQAPDLWDLRQDREFPQSLNNLLQMGLAKQSSDRPESMLAFKEKLTAISEGRTVELVASQAAAQTPQSPYHPSSAATEPSTGDVWSYLDEISDLWEEAEESGQVSTNQDSFASISALGDPIGQQDEEEPTIIDGSVELPPPPSFADTPSPPTATPQTPTTMPQTPTASPRRAVAGPKNRSLLSENRSVTSSNSPRKGLVGVRSHAELPRIKGSSLNKDKRPSPQGLPNPSSPNIPRIPGSGVKLGSNLRDKISTSSALRENTPAEFRTARKHPHSPGAQPKSNSKTIVLLLLLLLLIGGSAGGAYYYINYMPSISAGEKESASEAWESLLDLKFTIPIHRRPDRNKP